MRPTMFREMTHVLGAPTAWDVEKDGECGNLPVEIDNRGTHLAITSAWEPTPEELCELIAGGRVFLTVLSTQQPPVMLTVRPKE